MFEKLNGQELFTSLELTCFSWLATDGLMPVKRTAGKDFSPVLLNRQSYQEMNNYYTTNLDFFTGVTLSELESLDLTLLLAIFMACGSWDKVKSRYVLSIRSGWSLA